MHAAVVPERFVIDAKEIQVAGGGTLAVRPHGHPAVDSTYAPASPFVDGAGVVLGQGCFGMVTSMTYGGAPVAVKELSASTLDAASIGEPSAPVMSDWRPLVDYPSERCARPDQRMS